MEENFSSTQNTLKDVDYIEGRAAVGGLIFAHSNFPSLSLQEWVKSGCPSNTYISAYPDVLCVCRIPIADADNDRGVLRKKEPSRLTEKCHYRIPSYLLKEQKQAVIKEEEFEGIVCSHPKHQSINKVFHR